MPRPARNAREYRFDVNEAASRIDVSTRDSSENDASSAGTRWRQVAENAIEAQKNSAIGFVQEIQKLRRDLATSKKKAKTLREQLTESDKNQQQTFVDQIRKEEQLRQKEEHYMADKLADLTAEAEDRIFALQVEARANVSASEGRLLIETQKLQEANASIQSLKSQVKRWKGAAARSRDISQGRADALKRVADLELKFKAATHVAEQWRNRSLRALSLALGGSNLPEKDVLKVEAGRSPGSFAAVLNDMVKEREIEMKREEDKKRQRREFAADYPYASWELGTVDKSTMPPRHHSSPRQSAFSYLKSALPMTSISDLNLRSN